jgi:hypothetical protein
MADGVIYFIVADCLDCLRDYMVSRKRDTGEKFRRAGLGFLRLRSNRSIRNTLPQEKVSGFVLGSRGAAYCLGANCYRDCSGDPSADNVDLGNRGASGVSLRKAAVAYFIINQSATEQV